VPRPGRARVNRASGALVSTFMGKSMPVDPTAYRTRTYRRLIHGARLEAFEVVVKETDLRVSARQPLVAQTREAVLKYRGYLENYIEGHPGFVTTLAPWPLEGPAPAIVRAMILAGQQAGVGPMAAVAGAIAESVAREIMVFSDEVIVENGGDIFFNLKNKLTAAIFAGPSLLSMKIGLEVDGAGQSLALCTSSASVGHSLSFGGADAVCVLSHSGALADAAATAVGNRVGAGKDIGGAIDFGRAIPGIEGIVVVCQGQVGAWGAFKIVPLG